MSALFFIAIYMTSTTPSTTIGAGNPSVPTDAEPGSGDVFPTKKRKKAFSRSACSKKEKMSASKTSEEPSKEDPYGASKEDSPKASKEEESTTDERSLNGYMRKNLKSLEGVLVETLNKNY